MSHQFKRYCKTLTLKDDPELIEKYKAAHARENFWPEITRGMKEVGILDMELYLLGNRLFMIMDTVPDFDHEKGMEALAQKPRQGEWESFVSQFQQAGKDNSAGDKWRLMERIYEMEQQQEYAPEEGQLKECP
ncbi:L-rhamnose mutarotase [Fodinibius sediminis]|uniref:L-rhamnose mutarotase n=1 Tax=Fodinibius sediminis TaxID=1214077 RepID=A0A521C6T1_9BACT|nr:L-rhamnose mutarotase [Fodinibius sediminis]SMO54390.1 L-rhamnose mutarotase [Fodinibius sediminis]